MSLAYGIVLAAGKGTRMKSRLPKVLHQLGGKFMAQYVIDALQELGAGECIIVNGYEGQMVQEALGPDFTYALQEEQLGTGHAVMTALAKISAEEGQVMVVCGDTPLLRREALEDLLAEHMKKASACTVLTAHVDEPGGYGRIVRKADGSLLKIVEERDATPEERLIGEINTGTYCFDLKNLRALIGRLTPNNVQGEYYLTDLVALMAQENLAVHGHVTANFLETQGINDRIQLAQADQILRMRKLHELMLAGVTIKDPASTFVEQQVKIGPDTVIEPFTILRGKTEIGSDCVIGPQGDIRDTVIGDRVKINRSVLTEARVGDDCTIGPFAYLRPGAALGKQVKVGDFVEIKNARVGEKSKIPHLSYVGDAEVGSGVNVGCGTITCNYDGKNKFKTIIGDGVFIGSNTNLVAPVEVGAGAYVGAGSTITKEVPGDSLALGRARQVNFPDWAAKKRAQGQKDEHSR